MPTTYATAFVAHHARGSTFRLRDPTLRRPTMDWPRQHANRCFFRYASTQGPNRSAHRIGLPASGATRQPYSYASSQAQLLPPRRLLLSPRSTSGLSSSETLSPLPAPLWCSLPFRDGGAGGLFGGCLHTSWYRARVRDTSQVSNHPHVSCQYRPHRCDLSSDQQGRASHQS